MPRKATQVQIERYAESVSAWEKVTPEEFSGIPDTEKREAIVKSLTSLTTDDKAKLFIKRNLPAGKYRTLRVLSHVTLAQQTVMKSILTEQ